jgi:outer membrane lipoprotein-sorting protein
LHFAFKSPKYRLEVEGYFDDGDHPDSPLPAGAQLVSVFDGSTLWELFPVRKEYFRFAPPLPDGTSSRDVDRFPGIRTYADIMDIFSREGGVSIRVVREESLVTGSDAVDCFVIELAYQDRTHTLWVDKKQYYVLRADEEGETSTVYEMVKLNVPLPDELFKFETPAGSTEVHP